MAKKIARMGIFVALAMIFSYIEVLIPFQVGIPGVKLGVANIVTVMALYTFSKKEAFGILIIRIVLMSMLFSNGITLLYSLAGGILSFFVMCLLLKTKVFSCIGVSVAGGAFHNVGQILVAWCVVQNISVMMYLPILLVVGVITGLLIGIVTKQVIGVVKPLVAEK